MGFFPYGYNHRKFIKSSIYIEMYRALKKSLSLSKSVKIVPLKKIKKTFRMCVLCVYFNIVKNNMKNYN